MYLHEDTLVRIESELVAIKDVEEGMKVQSFVPHDRLFYHGLIKKIEKKDDLSFWKMQAGKREIMASPESIFVTSKGDGYLWRQLKDYQPGNLMIIQNLTSSVSFHEPIISIEKDVIKGPGYQLELKRYDNFVAEGFPVHTKPLPHEKERFFNF